MNNFCYNTCLTPWSASFFAFICLESRYVIPAEFKNKRICQSRSLKYCCNALKILKFDLS